MPRWLLDFDAIDPKNLEGRWKTGIHEKHYNAIRHSGHENKVARIMLVNEVLQNETKHLFRGWSRHDKEDSFVYVGTPGQDFKSLTIQTPAPPGMVFLVFVLPDGTIDDWIWRASRGENKPDGVTGELIWSSNQS